ncbi:MAG: lysophospholipase [Deltaproteobacteria bacterium CG11_big_fil_rev_8_21_14_0_20_47_16]|nr:MAG: lysophospholipase [Deltaproteobacteria bacterium CG11_big_fil_rev_8_21_14_0_20_47_16]
MDAQISHFTTLDGLKLFYQWWSPDKPKAVLVLVHGMGDHSGRYGPFIRYFVERGYAVALYDQRGHGRSGGERGHAEQFQNFLQDLSLFIQATKDRFPNLPFFLLGHSFGGQVALNFVVRYAKGLRGVILSSPNIQLKLPVPGWKKKVANWAKNSMKHVKLSHAIDAKMLTHDDAVADAYNHDPLVFSFVTAGLGAIVMQNLEIMMALASRVHLPALFLHAGQDEVCDPAGTKAFYQRVPIAKKRFIRYDDMRHEILNEVDRNRVFADIETWLEEQLKEDARDVRPHLRKVHDSSAPIGG